MGLHMPSSYLSINANSVHPSRGTHLKIKAKHDAQSMHMWQLDSFLYFKRNLTSLLPYAKSVGINSRTRTLVDRMDGITIR